MRPQVREVGDKTKPGRIFGGRRRRWGTVVVAVLTANAADELPATITATCQRTIQR